MNTIKSNKSLRTHSNTKVIILLVLFVVAMFLFGYALVPLYNVLCNALGINGKTGGQASAIIAKVDSSRWITVEFIANKNAYLPWDFYPLTKKIKIHPGENKQISYFAKNNSDKTMTVQAVPSVSPGIAAKYLRKTECFCFEQQTLKKGESIDMPMIFHLDPDLPKNIHIITLSYTLFDTAGILINRSKIRGKLTN